ncbi:helix-turn-helix domain-containing protein [Streptomyces mexicanus]|uniref:Helix-turn-helix transcriptional regulator n=1 Tax=Streptomyces mexicanus TaxID=178566 RepID=A0A7X1I288_9ACTN|nr:helix-turn-helix transcriptional regulator [Streptomyces mexicanus]
MPKVSIWDRGSWNAIRQVRGITYRQIAKACQVYGSTPQKWFAGEANPTLSHQIKLAKALGIPLEDALSGVTDPDVRAAIRYALENN